MTKKNGPNFVNWMEISRGIGCHFSGQSQAFSPDKQKAQTFPPLVAVLQQFSHRPPVPVAAFPDFQWKIFISWPDIWLLLLGGNSILLSGCAIYSADPRFSHIRQHFKSSVSFSSLGRVSKCFNPIEFHYWNEPVSRRFSKILRPNHRESLRFFVLGF